MELLEVAPVSWRTQQARVDPKKWKGHGKRMSDPLLMEYHWRNILDVLGLSWFFRTARSGARTASSHAAEERV
ncbi:g11375 [Coccomyxa viridis]|uniref:G11375 protein n=1 Tax=Coccomyxa viridis TaxID=1274662 RepID=A0ABP1G7U0_9CHLO